MPDRLTRSGPEWPIEGASDRRPLPCIRFSKRGGKEMATVLLRGSGVQALRQTPRTLLGAAGVRHERRDSSGGARPNRPWLRKPTWLASEKVSPNHWEKKIAGNSHGFPDWIEKWGRKPFLMVGSVVVAPAAIGTMALLGPSSALAWAVAVPAGLYWAVGLRDMKQTSHTIRRNFPVLGNIRYFFETIRPEIRQYFVESDSESMPFSRNHRSIVYARAKNMQDSLPFGTRRNVYEDGYEWVNHSLWPTTVPNENTRVMIGGSECKQPYSASLLNVSGMSYGALSDNAILALNGAAKKGNFFHNTGEGGISRFHLKPGGDIVWNIGTGYFGCRDHDGNFSLDRFKETASLEQVKMIELKFSQGAKPGHGGILPKSKVTEAIAEARGMELSKIKGDIVSPPRHTAFKNAKETLAFIRTLREASGGKPVGFKLCVGRPDEFACLVHAMLDTGILPDFITVISAQWFSCFVTRRLTKVVDGGEGGTGAAPPEYSNSVGMPLNEGLTVVHNMLRSANLRDQITIIASGKVSSGFSIVRALALGADVCNAARAMMLALGCIQALKCNTNTCPTGIATQDKRLMAGLDVDTKADRVRRYQTKTVNSALEIIGTIGLDHPDKVAPVHLFKRTSQRDVSSYEEVYPEVPMGCFSGEMVDPEVVRTNRVAAKLYPFWAAGKKLYERKQ